MTKLRQIAENDAKIFQLEDKINKNKKKYNLTHRIWVISGIASSVSMVGLIASPFAANISTVGALTALGITSASFAISMYGCTKILNEKENLEKELTDIKTINFNMENELSIVRNNSEELTNNNKNVSNEVKLPYKKHNRSRVLKPEE